MPLPPASSSIVYAHVTDRRSCAVETLTTQLNWGAVLDESKAQIAGEWEEEEDCVKNHRRIFSKNPA